MVVEKLRSFVWHLGVILGIRAVCVPPLLKVEGTVPLLLELAFVQMYYVCRNTWLSLLVSRPRTHFQ